MGCSCWVDSICQGTIIITTIESLSHQLKVTFVEKAHNADLHCVDWNPHDANFILTGSADNSVHMFDCRNLTPGGVGSPVYTDLKATKLLSYVCSGLQTKRLYLAVLRRMAL
eukprot:TRINITY_DN7853_c0_g2_i1.p1 TRINITY_DN7853_c0_g2~~TRINITY_DN7853_c0_g2_i1.p1  ORF type:complete len:112 (-),score=16.84 TRINITY_DN7853_c0_g2_i1:45-380(-)